jgi:hypothetical protein
VTPVLRNKFGNAKLTLHLNSFLLGHRLLALGYTSATHGKQAKQFPQHQHIQLTEGTTVSYSKKCLTCSNFCSRRDSVVIGRACFWQLTELCSITKLKQPPAKPYPLLHPLALSFPLSINTSSLLGSNFLLSTAFSYTFSRHSSLSVNDRV